MKKAFTLAEIMITLTVIGIISAIIMPIAINSIPDENVLKFKKANSTLYQVIQELVNSDKYYKDGDLGLKPDGTRVDNSDGVREYFCQTFADVVSAKSVNCVKTSLHPSYQARLLSNKSTGEVDTGDKVSQKVTDETTAGAKKIFDTACKNSASVMGAEIVTTDDITYYQTGMVQFGSQMHEKTETLPQFNLRYFSPPGQMPANYSDEYGFDINYKIFCIDIDGINKGEAPFGYGIRADGKILPGTRAEEWLKKDIQGEN